MNKISRRSFIPLLGTAVAGASALSFSGLHQREIPLKRYPNALRLGDTIGVCAPAGGMIAADEVSEFKNVLEGLGFNTLFSKNIAQNVGYFSGTDQQRAQDFMDLICNDEVKAIFFLRGGWGCARMLEFLDFESIRQHPKIIIGFSDPTSLLNAITQKTGLITFHGPGGNSTWNAYSVDYIQQLLMKGEMVHYQNREGDLPIITYQTGSVQGELVGGNMSIVCSMIGTEYAPDWEGKILFLEEVAEEPYRIDRMLTQLKLAGVFDKISGLILGTFRKCIAEEPDRSFALEEVFEQHFSTFEKPVFYGAQIGHTKHKFTVPIGAMAEMNAEVGTFKLLEPAVHVV